MSILEDCAAALRIGCAQAVAGNATMVSVFDDVLRHAAQHAETEAREMEVVAYFGASRLMDILQRRKEAKERRGQAVALAQKLGEPSRMLDSVDQLADALMELGENRLAIRYCNQAVALTRRSREKIGARLWRTGRCYVRAGFLIEAQAPLIEAIGYMRRPAHSLLKYALLDLGNAAMKSDPARAEAAIREAAEIFEREGHLNQAATSWLNLGVLCARSGRLDEALALYERTREAREKDPAATAAQRGNIHNNIAGVYRRKGEFARAREEVELAISILKPARGEMLAHAYGSYGEICRDAGEFKSSLEWFQRARAEFERGLSPNREKLAVKLENEAEALERLDRATEAAPLRERIARLRAEIAPPVPAQAIEVTPAVMGPEEEGAVIVTLDGVGLSDEVYAACDLQTLESAVERRVEETGAGELDGHERGPETVQLFLYGPNARALFAAIAPALRDYPLCKGATIELRQGEKVESFPLHEPTLN